MERRITELLGMDDDIVINFAISQLEEAADAGSQGQLCPKKM